jgi:DNA polymerase-3 subunit delta'
VSLIFGQDAPLATFRAALHGERLHHGWLLTGPQGVGKAMAALQIARRLLAEAVGLDPATPGMDVPFSHQTAKLMDAWSHPDFALIDRLPKDDKLVANTPRAEWSESEERARSIKVDQIRALNAMFATKPAMSFRRVIVIDEAETMEISAANALLKRLEEPPEGTIFLLVTHSPGRLLPTIRSRCRVLQFDTLSAADMRRALQTRLTDASPDEIDALIAAGQGSPGRALGFAGLDVAGLDAILATLAREGDAGNARRLALAQQLSAKAAQARYEVFLQRVPAVIAEAARQRTGDALGQALSQWEQARMLAGHAVSASLDPQNVVFTLAGHVAALAPGGASAKA